jgi:hypothetical protein
MKLLVRLLAVLSVFVCLASTAEAACSPGFYRNALRQANALRASATICQRAANRRSSITRTCSSCKGAVLGIISMERLLKANRSCFAQRDVRPALAVIRRYKPEIQFIRRGCGY